MLLLYVFIMLSILLFSKTVEINKWLISSFFIALSAIIYFVGKWKKVE